MQWEFLPFPPVILQLPPPCVYGPDDGLVVRVVILWPPEPYVPKPPDVLFCVQSYSLVANNAFSPLSCAARSTVPGSVVCWVDGA